MNENYPFPCLANAAEGAEAGILKGLYKLKSRGKSSKKAPRPGTDGR